MSLNSVNSTNSSSSTLFEGSSQKALLATRNHFMGRKPKSVEDVRDTMSEMDRLNKTSFSKWIRSEKNLSYLCSYKGDLIHQYLSEDGESAMHALCWITEDWTVESVAELVLKLFYAERMDSPLFAKRLWGLCKDWSTERLVELLPILLIGESVSTCSQFFANFYNVSSGDDGNTDEAEVSSSTERLADLVLPIAHGFKWNADQLESFLLETVVALVSDSPTQRSMVIVIHDEIDTTLNKILLGVKGVDILNTFEILYHIILEEKERFVEQSRSRTSRVSLKQQEDFMNLDIPFLFDREE